MGSWVAEFVLTVYRFSKKPLQISKLLQNDNKYITVLIVSFSPFKLILRVNLLAKVTTRNAEHKFIRFNWDNSRMS